MPGSRTVRGLMITSGKGLFKGSVVLLLLRTLRLFRSNVPKLDGFCGVLFSCSLCRLTLLFCSVCVLLFHGHRHPDRCLAKNVSSFGAGDPVLCETAYLVPVATHGPCAFLRASEVPGTLMLLIGEDTWQVLEARFDQEWMNCRMCSVLPRQSFLYFVSSVDLLGLSAFVLPFL